MRSLAHKPTQVQPRGATNLEQLSVNRPGDLHEQEAERVADQVARDGSPAPRIARPTAPGTGSARLDPELAANGRPLESGVRKVFERQFGHDFSRVRVHSDHAAAESARGAGANAYTVGSSIVFGADRFNPSTPRGERLLAHELTHVVQQSAAHGGQSNGIFAQRDPVPQVPAPAAKAKPTNIRDALDELFEEFNNSIVGDTIFDKIMSRKAWMEEKVAEYEYPTSQAKKDYETKLAKYKTDLKEWQTDKKKEKPGPPEVPKGAHNMTTCIEAQKVLLQQAFQRVPGAKIKPVGKVANYYFGTEGEKSALAIDPAAWHKASPGMKERPKNKDIIVLSERGKSVDDADKELKAAMKKNTPKEISVAQAALKEALQAAEESSKKVKEAEAALEAETRSKTSAAVIKATGALGAARIQVKIASKKAADAADSLAKKESAVPNAEKKLAEKRAAVDHSKWFAFSHVGFVVSITPIPNPKKEKETWETFDGGQTVRDRKPNEPKGGEPEDDKRIGNDPKLQGTKKNTRTYDPETNEIQGEASQGGVPRWLQGWVDIDKLVQ